LDNFIKTTSVSDERNLAECLDPSLGNGWKVMKKLWKVKEWD
jgi:hypothetical protein